MAVKIYRRLEKGPCIFCRRENVPFTEEEHLPPESIVDRRCYVLVDWVCDHCNNELSVEDEHFGKHYHGSAGRIFYAIIGKKGKGAEVALKEFWGKFRPKINMVQLKITTRKKREQLLSELSNLDNRQATILELSKRTINTRRLGRCLAKMALETVACVKPEIVLNSELDALRDYARGRGKLKFLPFAVGVSKGVYGAGMWLPESTERSYAPVALIWIPASVYAIQLFDFDDLRPLQTVAESMGLVFDDTGKRTENTGLNINLEFVPTPQ
jgi:hypothetical protein